MTLRSPVRDCHFTLGTTVKFRGQFDLRHYGRGRFTKPKLRLAGRLNPLPGLGFSVCRGLVSVYLPRCRGMAMPIRSKAWRWVGVGSARAGTTGPLSPLRQIWGRKNIAVHPIAMYTGTVNHLGAPTHSTRNSIPTAAVIHTIHSNTTPAPPYTSATAKGVYEPARARR